MICVVFLIYTFTIKNVEIFIIRISILKFDEKKYFRDFETIVKKKIFLPSKTQFGGKRYEIWMLKT